MKLFYIKRVTSRISNNHSESKMEGCKALFVGFLLFSWGGLSIIVSGDTSKSCEFPAIYNFGDSNSATGNSSTILKSSLSPHADGRACDGRVIIDFIGNKLFLRCQYHVSHFQISFILNKLKYLLCS